MRLAHFSDIHFFQFCFDPLQIFSKRVLGNFNYFFRRRHIHNQSLPYRLIETLHKLKVGHLVITGDFTCIASHQEFKKMQNYIQLLVKEGFKIYTLPGNHDSYTKRSEKNRTFYRYLAPIVDFAGHTPLNLIDHRVAAYRLLDKWWLVCVDCAHAMPYNDSTGLFAPETEGHLQTLLASLPKDASIILANHFPYDDHRPHALLKRGEMMKKIFMGHPQIRIYMHGHRHQHRIEEGERGKLILDSGSITLKSESTFNLLELEKDSYSVTPYCYQNSTWEKGHGKRCMV